MSGIRLHASVPDTLTVVPDTVSVTDFVEVEEALVVDSVAPSKTDSVALVRELSDLELSLGCSEIGEKLTLYDFPYSRERSMPNWRRMWLNTSILMTAGVTTMLILESLPSDATAWNKTENEKVPLFKRWWRNVHKGPVWDHDNPIFNYVLHPYAGAAYYMGARSNGFNMWGSFLYSFCISTFFWEYGFEAFNEVPSVQDLIITPVVGSILGEGFYIAKRYIVSNGYRLFGSKIAGYAVAFLLDPLNELCGYFRGDQKKLARRADNRRNHMAESGGLDLSTWIAPSTAGLQGGISITYTF
ncbi:MAG: DUF3943 domain-containing protein [Bacteroides sp.]|nr:DUF3943 domain-containing protein [Bacteroides sp.]